MGRFLSRVAGVVVGAGLPRRQRLFRITSNICMLAALGLLVAAGLVGLESNGPVRKPLPKGTVFSVPVSARRLATPSATTTSSATLVSTPMPTSSPTASPTDAPTEEPTAEASATPESQDTPAAAASEEQSPQPDPGPPPDDSPVSRLVIPAIKVNAPISFKDVDANGVMQAPNSWNDVAYYPFTGHPGYGGGNNAVFAGHVDYYPHRTAVFWDLRKLQPGDQIHVLLQDGTDFTYTVTEMVVYGSDDALLTKILEETPDESVTLITCDGIFANGEYNERLVVRAVRQAG